MDFVGLRVSENADRLYTAWRSARGFPFGFVCATGLDGALRWYKEVKVSGDAFGGFEVSEDGRLHVVLSGRGKQRLVIYDAQGTDVTGTSTLGLPDDEYAVQDLRIHGDRYYVKRNDPRYLFQVYDRVSGARLDWEAVPADVEQLTVQYDAHVWTAGERMPLTVTHTPGNWANRPGFRVWLRPLGVPEFTELPLSVGAVVPAADARGLYHVRVSPDVAGRHSEYVVDSGVEIRPHGAVNGSLSLMSCRIVQDGQGDPARVDLNRLHYGRGEAVTVAVQARVAPGGATACRRTRRAEAGRYGAQRVECRPGRPGPRDARDRRGRHRHA